MRGQPSPEDLRTLEEFRQTLQLPTRQEIRLALIRQGPPSHDPADCICAVLKDCASDTPCPYCRTSPDGGCPQAGRP